jgi:hypothetical protein
MTKKRKDTLITKEEARSEANSSKPSHELLRLIELVNEFGVLYRVKRPNLPSSQMISDKIYSESEIYIENQYEDWAGSDPIPVIKRKKSVTAEQILKEIRQITKDLPKLYSFLFDVAQDLYPITNKRYVKNTNDEWDEKIEGVIEKYDDIRLFAANLTQVAVLSNIHIRMMGLEKLRQLKLRQGYYLDMASSRYYIDNGRFKFELDLLAQHLQDIEAARLRYCLVCQSVFWAYDLRKVYCSRKCSNRFSQKKWYAKPDNKEQFLRNKKAEYHINKGSNRFPSRVKKEEEK